MQHSFIYNEAFSRNIGWVTTEEQSQLRHKKVAIAGLGGVGGSHLLTLCRLGIGKFHLAEFDTFDLANFNRQVGANVQTIGQSKLAVMVKQALEINPELEITQFPNGINENNSAEFLADIDIYIDGLDFFAFNARQHIFASCTARNIPAVTAAPLGMGTAVLNFIPGSMTFEDYFDLKNSSEEEKGLRFFIGLAPSRLQMNYLVDPTTIDLANHKGPSTIMACQLCAGAAATEALKILLGRGPIRAAPKGYHYDAYLNKLALTWRPWGNRNLLSRLAIFLARRKLKHA